jgi:DNA-binding MarR family transcriptional regulator
MMNSRNGGRTAGEIPGLDIAEVSSWQHYLTASLLLCATLNRRLINAHSLSMADLLLLQTLSSSPDGGVRAGDLSVSLGVLPCRLTRQTRRLEGQGLIQRCVSPEDRRGVVVEITADGRLIADRAAMTYAQNVRVIFLNCLSRAQIDAMAATCNRIGAPLERSQNSLQRGKFQTAAQDFRMT